MKIAVLTDNFTLGGLESHIITFTNELLKRGHQIMLSTGKSNPDLLGLIHAGADNFEHRNWSADPIKDIAEFNPDLIHSHPFKAVRIGHESALALHKPLFVTMHGLYDIEVDRSPQGYQNVQNISRIIAVDLGVAAVLINSAVHPEKVSVIRNGIDLQTFRDAPVKPQQTAHVGLIPDWFTIVFVGRIEGGKETPLLQLMECIPMLVKKLGGLNIVIVGEGHRFPFIKEKAVHLNRGLSNSVHIHIAGRQMNVLTYLLLADLVLACDRAALEAMACERPVFAGNADGFAGAIGDHNHHEVLFCRRGYRPYSNYQLVNELVILARNKEFREQLSTGGREITSRFYNITEAVTQLERIYTQYL